MHCYGNWPDERFNEIENAAQYIGIGLSRWFRIGVMQYKEKFGTARVYCHLGWDSFYSIWRPNDHFVPKWWPYLLDLNIFNTLFFWINYIIIPIQKSGYRYFYKQALRKWPHLKDEILCCADFGELLKDL